MAELVLLTLSLPSIWAGTQAEAWYRGLLLSRGPRPTLDQSDESQGCYCAVGSGVLWPPKVNKEASCSVAADNCLATMKKDIKRAA